MHKNIPFIEKYRPKKIEDIILPIQIYNKIINLIETDTLPNLIINGLPGTGKTSTILCIAKKILGKEYKEYILELNASNNRTLEFINTTISYFCKKKKDLPENKYKLIIFDEADNITKKAQYLLANIMEEHYHNTRFAFTCNDSTKLIESIQSRCMILKFLPMTNDNIKKKIEQICSKEKIIYDDNGINELINISNGDIRCAINNLESIHNGYKYISKENVNKICYHPHINLSKEIINNCINLNLENALDTIDIFKKNGYCANDILMILLNTVKDIDIDENIKINFIKIISDFYIIISDGNETNLQLYACICHMIKFINNKSIIK